MNNIKTSNTSLSTNKSPKFSVAIQNDAYQKLINDTLGDSKIARRFIANISSVVANNTGLQKCDTGSLVVGALQAESLNLPLNQSLGFAYLVPYGGSAQFQVGYKGFIQLAIRTGQYQDIDAFEIREGEYLGRDSSTGKPTFKFIEDDDEALEKPIVGYMATFTLTNGFTKQLYWSKEKAEKHAKRFSKSYGTGKATDNWTNQFDTMALKTVIKQLLSKYGILSAELQTAIETDQATFNERAEKVYVDNPNEETGEIEVKPQENIKQVLKQKAVEPEIVIEPDDDYEEFEEKSYNETRDTINLF